MSDLESEKWAVISDRESEATGLTHEDARRLVHRLTGEGRRGLCIISDEAAKRMALNRAESNSPRAPDTL